MVRTLQGLYRRLNGRTYYSARTRSGPTKLATTSLKRNGLRLKRPHKFIPSPCASYNHYPSLQRYNLLSSTTEAASWITLPELQTIFAFAVATFKMSDHQRTGLNIVVREKALAYMTSFPGSDDYGTNSFHRRLRRIIKGELFDEMHYYDRILNYRRSLLEQANRFRKLLGPESPHPKV